MAARESVTQLMRLISSASCKCPHHSQKFSSALPGAHVCSSKHHATSAAPDSSSKEYAFEMAMSNIRYGEGVTQEVGMDLNNLGCKKVVLFTDEGIKATPIHSAVLDSLNKNNVNYDIYDRTRVEPSDKSFKDAIEFCRAGSYDGYLAVGGGSVMDTCKAANLYASKPDADFMDYVNAPIGKGLPVTHKVNPMLAIPTTSGTGSETTGVAVFDLEDMKAKTGIANRAIRPLLGIVDPLHTRYMPERVFAYSGFDVLCHALESYTALPFNERSPRPLDPKERPAYQGSNPISDIWSKHALRIVSKYFKRGVYNADDMEARSNMHLASTIAGIGFGNAGVHLCHGLSYPIAGMVRSFKPDGYVADHPTVPHGLSVVITSPQVFDFTAPACPERHLEGAELLGADITNAKRADAGKILADVMRGYMHDMKIEDGLKPLGYTTDDIPAMVEAVKPQTRVTKLSPREKTDDDIAMIFEKSMSVY